MDQIVLLIVIAAIGLAKWVLENVSQKSEEARRDREGNREPLGQKPEESLRPAPRGETPEEERMRRFMEALGLPADGAPPPATRRAAAPQAPQPQTIPDPATPRPQPPVQPPRPPIRRTAVEPKRWGNHPEPAKRKPVPAPAPAPDPVPEPATTPVAAPFKPLEAFPEIPDAAPTSSVAPPMEIASLENRPEAPGGPSRPRSGSIAALRGELRGSAALRRAFVLREILGPPVAMKS